MEMISSVETTEVLSGPSEDVGRVPASNDEVAVVAEQTSHCSGVVAMIDTEDFGPVRGLGDFADMPSTDRTTPILLSEESIVVFGRDAIPTLESDPPPAFMR